MSGPNTGTAAPSSQNMSTRPANGPQDWDMGTKTLLDLERLDGYVAELAVSDDGGHAAAVIEKSPEERIIAVDNQPWEPALEKAWSLRFTSDGRAFALVRIDDEWTIMVDGTPWEERFEFAWNPKLAGGGKVIGVQTKSDMQYSVAVDGKLWDARFLSCRDYALSPDGSRVAAAVQIEELPEADVFKFLEGTWTVVVDEEPWPRKYLNVYTPIFSLDGKHVAAQVRTDATDYTAAIDNQPWAQVFTCIWEPRYRTGSDVLLPVRQQGGWFLAQNGKILWPSKYVQLWHACVSPQDERIAAVVATAYGRWTVAVDDVPWKTTFSDMVAAPVFSPDGHKVAAAVKHDGRWSIAVDGVPWMPTFDMVWEPVFSPGGESIATIVKENGKQSLVVNGRVHSRSFDRLWAPAFSPTGKQILLRGVDGTRVIREVIATTEV